MNDQRIIKYVGTFIVIALVSTLIITKLVFAGDQINLKEEISDTYNADVATQSSQVCKTSDGKINESIILMIIGSIGLLGVKKKES